jgi:hypothetical protein
MPQKGKLDLKRRGYRRLDFLTAMVGRTAFAFFVGRGFGFDLARVFLAFDASASDSSYAS